MILRLVSALVPITAWILWLRPWDNGLTNEFDPETVLSRGLELTSRSWEYGTLAQAMLELRNPTLTVYSMDPFPAGRIPTITHSSTILGLRYAKSVIWTNNSDLLIDGEGSPADPASLGTAALLLGTGDPAYLAAAKRQANYLVDKATRYQVNSTHAAISHRNKPPELWGDFIYMVPPFLAYYGVATQDFRFLHEAVQQCQLYNEVLVTEIALDSGSTCRGLWSHIVSEPRNLPPAVCCSDPNVWLTSAAWAVAGITRVLATISRWRPPVGSEIEELAYTQFCGTSEKALVRILTSMLGCLMGQARDRKTGLLKNYLDGDLHDTARYNYGDAAGTALMAAAVYRLAVLLPESFGTSIYLDWAEASREAVFRHVDKRGRVSPVADVSHVPSRGPAEQTSEGQSMALLMYSAWRDWMTATELMH